MKLPLTLANIGDETAGRVHPTARVAIATEVAPALAGLRVLVVDDDHDALDLATAILTAARAGPRPRPSR